MMTIHEFKNKKNKQEKLTMLTCYDFWSAQIINESNVDCILVGDSLAMVMHGSRDTLMATPDLMALHVKAVAKGAPGKFIVGDMPFLAHRKGLRAGMTAVEKIMRAGAHSVKIEGALGHSDFIKYVVDSGVPVMGHIGLTPQSIHQLGGFKVQGKDASAAESLLYQAQLLEDAGCFAVVLECVPRSLAQQVTEKIKIPTIGIGAGQGTDGQVLVLQDMLGFNSNFKPKFLRTYLDGKNLLLSAMNTYVDDVKTKEFPSDQESYL